jgi:uncharacterized protein with von Willebrand factor type A (vWA) domain
MMETKITEYQNEAGEVTSRKRQICKNLRLQGTDWLFTSAKISTMTDEELTASIEYHNEIKSQMIQERETRRVEHFQKLKGIKLNYTPREDVDSTGAIKKPKASKKKTVKVSKSEPDANAIAAAFSTLLGAKVTQEAVLDMMQKMGVNNVKRN